MNNHEILSLKVLYLEKKTDSDITSILTLYVHVEQVAICQAQHGDSFRHHVVSIT